MTENNHLPSWQYIPPSTQESGDVIDATRFMKGSPRTPQKTMETPASATSEETPAAPAADAQKNSSSAEAPSQATVEESSPETHLTEETAAAPEATEYSTPSENERQSFNRDQSGYRGRRDRGDFQGRRREQRGGDRRGGYRPEGQSFQRRSDSSREAGDRRPSYRSESSPSAADNGGKKPGNWFANAWKGLLSAFKGKKTQPATEDRPPYSSNGRPDFRQNRGGGYRGGRGRSGYRRGGRGGGHNRQFRDRGPGGPRGES